MKKFKKLILAGFLALSTLAGFFGIKAAANNNVNAAIPSGQTLDENPDNISFSNLTFENGKTNQTMLNVRESTNATYTKNNENGSIVFNFKYDVVDDTNSDKIEFRVKFDYDKDGSLGENNALWIRGDKVYLNRDNGAGTYGWNGNTALTKGTHTIEYGRIALYEGDTPNGDYYVYYKVDGTEIDSSIFDELDPNKLGNRIGFNTNFKTENVAYDANLTYEKPQYLTVSDLKDGKKSIGSTMPSRKLFTYDTANATAHNSVVFVADVDYKAQEDSQIYFTYPTEPKWQQSGYIWFQKDKVYFGITDETGAKVSDKEVKYRKYEALTDNSPVEFTLETGSKHTIEYGRLAVMDGTTFKDRYHVYFKLDGKLMYAIDQVLPAEVMNAGAMRFTGDGNFDFLDSTAYTTETPKVISVSDLLKNGNKFGDTLYINDQYDLTYDNSNHTDNYSLVFKYKYKVNELKNNQFHLTYSDQKWNTGGSFILNNTNGKDNNFGIANANDCNAGWIDEKDSFNFDVGKTYDVEYGRIARLYNGQPTGTYEVYLKIDDTMIRKTVNTFSQALLQGNLVFITADGHNEIIDANPSVYETPDQISISDLKTQAHGNNVGDLFVANGDKYTYDATASNKSVVFKFNLVRNGSAEGSQIHFKNGYLEGNGGCIWLRHDQNMITKMSSGYAVGKDVNWVSGMNAVEIGKLYVTSGANAGKYYIYVKANGRLEVEYIVDSMPNENVIFISKGQQDVFYDIDATQQTTPEFTSAPSDTKVTLSTPIYNWKKSDAVVEFDSSKASVTLAFCPNGTEGRHTGKVTVYGQAVYGNPNNYYHYSIAVKDLQTNGSSADARPIKVLQFRDGAYDYANLKVTNNITFETADVISISDLKKGGNSVGDSLTLSTANQAYSYDATAAHKSVALQFTIDSTSTNPIQSQFHFNDNYIGDLLGGMMWFTDKLYIRKDSTTTESQYSSIASPFAADKTYSVEIGKLYITSGSNNGKYYIYAKVNGDIILDDIVASMPDKANIFMTGNKGNTLYDVNYVAVTYEEADRVSIADLKVDGNYVGESYTVTSATGQTFNYDATAEHKSVIFEFDIIRTTKNDGAQIHFNDGYLGDAAGCVWLRGDKMLIYTENYGLRWADSAINWIDGKNRVEIGKLYMLSGSNTGKYYLYVKLNGKLEVSYVCDMPNKNCIFITKGSEDTYYEINPLTYENPDVVSVGDLKQNGAPYIDVITLDSHQTFTYDATAAHKSVVYKFLYDVTGKGNIGIQFHFDSSWTNGKKGGMIWFSDKVRITKDVASDADASYVTVNSPFTHNGIYEVELGKLYITGGKNTGKYYSYVKVDGEILAEYVEATMPDSDALFITGTNGDYMYDVDYMPVELNTGLYLYNWDVNNSGIQFAATLRKDFVAYDEISNVGFVIYPQSNPTAQIKVAGKLVASGDNYVVKAALLGFNANEFTSEYVAKLFYVVDGEERYSDVIATSFYDEVCKISDAGAYQNAIDAVKAAVLNVTVDEDTMEVVGATKSGTDPIVLTGEKSQYAGFILNGKVVANGQTIMIGYTYYGVALAANTITLTKLDKDMVWGGSEHFVEINPGHDTDMTAANLAPMTTELGLETVRLDFDFNRLFTLLSDNTLKVNYDAVANTQSVIDELKKNGGVTDFLGVIWTLLPYNYKRWTGAPWAGRVVPGDEENYLLWLQINGEAAKIAAELFPDIHNFETWNEAEIMAKEADGIECTMTKITSYELVKDGDDKVTGCNITTSNFTVAEKAQILTDLMYYLNKGIKEVNSDNVLTTPSIGCAQESYLQANTDETRFATSSYNFLKAMYDAINDNTPVTGYTSLDKDANNYFEVINVHPYLILGIDTTNWTDYINSLSTLAGLYGDAGTEIWVTEFGFAQNRYATAQADMLSIIGQAKQIDCLTKFYFYKVHDYLAKEGPGESNDHWGLYNYDCTIKDIGTAVKAAINPAE